MMCCEELCEIKEALIEKAHEQLDCLEYVNTKELGQVIDMIKDIEQTCYYHTIIKAMENKEENSEEIEKHLNANIEGI